MKYNFTLSVWGARYLDVFLKASLPLIIQQLKKSFYKKNLGKFYIYSNEQGINLIKKSEIYDQINKIIDLKLLNFMQIKQIKSIDKFDISTACFVQTYKSISKLPNINYVFNLTPETIIYDGFFSSICVRLKKNDLVMMTGLRVNDQELFKLYKTKISNNLFDYFSRMNLADDYFNNMHSLAKRHNLYSKLDGFNSFPSQFHFHLSKNIHVIKAFHLHPVAFKINTSFDYKKINTIDGNFIDRNFTKDLIKNSVMVNNSFMLELTPVEDGLKNKANFILFIRYFISLFIHSVNKNHLFFFSKNILIYSKVIIKRYKVLIMLMNIIYIPVFLLYYSMHPVRFYYKLKKSI